MLSPGVELADPGGAGNHDPTGQQRLAAKRPGSPSRTGPAVRTIDLQWIVFTFALLASWQPGYFVIRFVVKPCFSINAITPRGPIRWSAPTATNTLSCSNSFDSFGIQSASRL